MPLATLTNMGIGPISGPTNKEWSSKLGKLGKCSEINIKLCIINLSSKNGHGISPGFGMVTEFLAARINKNCEKIFETMASSQGGWCLIVATRSVRYSIKIRYIYIYIYMWFKT